MPGERVSSLLLGRCRGIELPSGGFIMDELERTIDEDMQEELYRRGYGVERLGSVNGQNEWIMLALVAIGLYLVWGT